MKRWTEVRVVLVALLLASFVHPRCLADVSAAVIEFHNLTDEALPRVGEYTENSFYRYLVRHSRLALKDRTAVSALLIARRDRVVLFPSDPALAASFARDLGVGYILTGNILEYSYEDGHHEMTVEVIVIGAEEEAAIYRKIYSADYLDATGYKKHREILDQIIETLSVDFEEIIERTEGKRELARQEELRRQQEVAQLAEEARLAELRRIAEEKARREAERRAEAGRGARADAFQRDTTVVEDPTNAVLINVQFQDVTLLKDDTWGSLGEGKAEFALSVLRLQKSGNAQAYTLPYEGSIPLALGERLIVVDNGFMIRVAPGDGNVTLLVSGVDSDEPSTAAGLLLSQAMSFLSSSAKAIATSLGAKPGRAMLFGILAGLGGELAARFIQENDVIGEGSIVLDSSGGSFADGKVHTMVSENEAMQVRFKVKLAR